MRPPARPAGFGEDNLDAAIAVIGSLIYAASWFIVAHAIRVVGEANVPIER